MEWSGEQGGFVIEMFFKNEDSLIATQRAFRTHFQLGCHASVMDQELDTKLKGFPVPHARGL